MQFLKQNWNDEKGLVSDWLTMTAPVFNIINHFRQPNEHTGLVFDEKIEDWRQCKLMVSANLAYFPIATYTERRLWLLIINHALRGNSLPIQSVIDGNSKLSPKDKITLSLFDVFGVLPFPFMQYKRVKTNNFHIDEMKQAIYSLTAVADVLENTIIKLPELGIELPLLSGFDVVAKEARYPHDVKLTFRLPDWWVNQLLFGYVTLPYSHLNMESNIEMRLYERCVLLNLSPQNSFYIGSFQEFLTHSIDNISPTQNDRKKLEKIISNNNLPDFYLEYHRNSDEIVVFLREKNACQNSEISIK